MANIIRPYHLTSRLLSLAMSFKQAFRLKVAKRDQIGYFRVAPSLCFKAKLGAKPLIWKWRFILMQIKLIFTRKVLHLASFRKWEILALWKSEALVFCGSPPRDLWLSRFLKGQLTRGLAKGTIKRRATKTCNFLCNIAAKTGWDIRCCTFYHPRSNLSCNKSGFCRLQKVVAKSRE